MPAINILFNTDSPKGPGRQFHGTVELHRTEKPSQRNHREFEKKCCCFPPISLPRNFRFGKDFLYKTRISFIKLNFRWKIVIFHAKINIFSTCYARPPRLCSPLTIVRRPQSICWSIQIRQRDQEIVSWHCWAAQHRKTVPTESRGVWKKTCFPPSNFRFEGIPL